MASYIGLPSRRWQFDSALSLHALLAQQEEHLIGIQEVVSSILTVGSNSSKYTRTKMIAHYWASQGVTEPAIPNRRSAQLATLGLFQKLHTRVTHKWWCARLPTWNRDGSIPFTRSRSFLYF